MRLYPRKLRNIKDLEKEKKRLQKESSLMEGDAFLSLGNIIGDKKQDGGGSLADLLTPTNPVVVLLGKLIQRKFQKKDDAPKPVSAREQKATKKKKSFLASVAFEFVGGYLKWKAVELSYKGIVYLIKKRKEKEAE